MRAVKVLANLPFCTDSLEPSLLTKYGICSLRSKYGILCTAPYIMPGSRKLCQRRGGNFDGFFFFVCVFFAYHYKRAIIGSPAKHHLMVFGWCNIECWLSSFAIFQRIWTTFAYKPYVFVIFQGVQTPCPPFWIRPW